MESLSKEKKDLPYGDIILVEKPGDAPATILNHSVGLCGTNLKWKYTKLDNSCNCTIYINSEQVACAINCKKEFAKEAASALALDRLRKYYHTVKIKQNSNATLTTIKKTKSQNRVYIDNSRKLMKLLGWTCESLRSSQESNMEPVMLNQQLSREGLGLKSSSSNMSRLKVKCKIMFRKLLRGDMQNDIVFSMNFTNKDKEMVFHMARSMGVKFYIDDSSDPTKLVIFHQVSVQSLFEKLKSLAGTTETYELIQPTDLDNELDIVDRTIEKYKLIESANLDEKAKDLEDSIEKYESIEPTSLVEETRCVTQTSIITKKAILNKTNKKLKSEIEDTTETLNNYKMPSTNIMESSCKKEKNPYGDIILVEKSGDIPETILMNSVGISKKNYQCKRTKFCNSSGYTIYINSKQVACASNCNQKCAKKTVFALALDELRKYYHTIKMKQDSNAEMNVTLTMIEKMKFGDTISDDNIGKKLLKLMGWSGGGLGKSQQGIMEPVTYAQHLGRQGLGLKSCSSNMEVNQELKAKCKIIFEKLLRGDIQNNVVFSTDFTNYEKAMINEVARSMGLKSRSRGGPSDKAKLVISHKVNIRSLFEELKSGRTNEKYELIEPTYLDDKLDSVGGTTETYDLTESTSLDAEIKDFEWTTEKYESIEPTNLVEELDQKCIAKKSIIEEHISDNQSDKKFKSKVEETKTENNPNTSIMGSPSKENKDLPYGDIILVEKPGDVPETILNTSIGISSKNIQCTCIKFHNSCYCTICINSIQVASVSDCTKEHARAAAFALALDELRKYYPTVKIKQSPDAQTNANLTTIQKTIFQNKFLDDNVEKLMKLLGWTHDILRNCQQDIMKSVTVTHSKHLKSFVYGPLSQKKLVSRIDIPSLFKKLKKLAETTEKYELIEPINLDYKLDNDGTTEKYEIESTSLDEEVKDLEGITEKYESSLVEELNTLCITQTPTIIEKPILDETNKKLKSEIEDTKIVSDHKSSGTSIMESLSKDRKDFLYGNIILVEKPGDVPETILKHSFGISSKNLNWRFTRFYDACDCTIYINSNQIACASDCSRKCAKETAFALALNELRKYYYTIKIKQNTDAQTNVTLTTVEETMSKDNIREDKIGKKLMKLIGQSGDIIREFLQNMKEPVTLNQQLSRENLGLTSNSSNMCELKARCRIAFEMLLVENVQYNIIFSTDFTNDERLIIHQVAYSMGLESRNRPNQKLKISRGFNILSLVEELKSLGGTTEKYELIEPTNLRDKVENVDGSTEKYEIGSTSLDEEVKDLDGTTKKYESIDPINEFWWNYGEIQIDKTK